MACPWAGHGRVGLHRNVYLCIVRESVSAEERAGAAAVGTWPIEALRKGEVERGHEPASRSWSR